MTALNLKLVTPEKTVLSEELVSLTCPTDMGEITILPGHVPLVANLQAGELKAKTASDEHFIYVAGGFVEVRAGGEVVVLADDAEHHYAIDIQKALEATKRAEAALKERQLSGQEYARVAATLQQNLARIKVARRHSQRSGPALEQETFRE